jgi:hypothetical protein
LWHTHLPLQAAAIRDFAYTGREQVIAIVGIGSEVKFEVHQAEVGSIKAERTTPGAANIGVSFEEVIELKPRFIPHGPMCVGLD